MIADSKPCFANKFSRILLCEQAPLSFLLGILGLVAGLGFAAADYSGSNYSAILAFAPGWLWALTFVLYGVLKQVQAFVNLNKYFSIFNAVFGMWLWSYVLLSSTLFDKLKTTPTEYMLAVPLLCEVWALAAILYILKNSYTKRAQHGSS